MPCRSPLRGRFCIAKIEVRRNPNPNRRDAGPPRSGLLQGTHSAPPVDSAPDRHSAGALGWGTPTPPYPPGGGGGPAVEGRGVVGGRGGGGGGGGAWGAAGGWRAGVAGGRVVAG